MFYRIYITQDDIDTLKLTIKEIQNMDGGTYTCEGVVEGSVQRKEVTLEIYSKEAVNPGHIF